MWRLTIGQMRMTESGYELEDKVRFESENPSVLCGLIAQLTEYEGDRKTAYKIQFVEAREE